MIMQRRPSPGNRIYAKCRLCGRTLTGDYEKRDGACASFMKCTDRRRLRDHETSK